MIEIPEECKLTAHHTGDAWLLAVENYNMSDVIAYLAWPVSWPETMTSEQLRAHGFVIVP